MAADTISTADLLFEAIEKGDVDIVEALLAKGADPSARWRRDGFTTPLRLALERGQEEIAVRLIRHKANAKEPGLIYMALRNTKLLELLIASGADVQNKGFSGYSPLMKVCELDLPDAAEILRRHGADVNAPGSLGLTPLHVAALHCNVRSVKWLLDHGADVNAGGQSESPISRATKDQGGCFEVFKMLLEHGADLSTNAIKSITKNACLQGNLNILKMLEAKSIHPDFDACYPMLAHASSTKPDMLKWLTDHNKIKNMKVGNTTLLHIAAEHDNFEIVRLLLESGADVNAPSGYAYRPVLASILLEDRKPQLEDYPKEMAELLISKGADPNMIYGQNEHTLLHDLAAAEQWSRDERWKMCCQKRTVIAENMISHGADVSARDRDGNTPLHVAARTGNVQMIEMLLAHNADLKALNKLKQTPLQHTITAGHMYIAEGRLLVTIGKLVLLETQHGGEVDWSSLRCSAGKLADSKRKEAIASLLFWLSREKLKEMSEKKLTDAAAETINNMPKSIEEQLASCNAAIALAAAEQIIKAPKTLREPLELFPVTVTLYRLGRKDEAVFWFYVAYLRGQHQAIVKGGDVGQLLTVMKMTIGPPILNYAYQDVKKLNRILDKVAAWNKSHPNPFREEAENKQDRNRMDQAVQNMLALKAENLRNKDKIEKKVKTAAKELEQTYGVFTKECKKDLSTGQAKDVKEQARMWLYGFPGLKLPAEFDVLAAGAYSGRKVGYTGKIPTEMDVWIDYPEKPVVMLLGAYDPNVWRIRYSRKTKILAVLVSGYREQVIEGLDDSIPVSISTHDNYGPSGYFCDIRGEQKEQVDLMAQRVFSRPVSAYYPVSNGEIVIAAPTAKKSENLKR